MLFQETKLNNAMQLERFERHLTNEVGLDHYKLFVNDVRALRTDSIANRRLGVATYLHRSLPGFDQLDHLVQYDVAGRYLVVRTLWGGVPVYIHNVYAPVEAHLRSGFFDGLPRDFEPASLHLVGGDFNLPMDPDLDSGRDRALRVPGQHECVSWLTDLRVVDAWRRHHPTERAMSGPNRVNRLDYLFLDRELVDQFYQGSVYGANGHGGDHQSHSVTLSAAPGAPGRPYWRLPRELLLDPEVVAAIKTDATDLLERMTTTPNANHGAMWYGWLKRVQRNLHQCHRRLLLRTNAVLHDLRLRLAVAHRDHALSGTGLGAVTAAQLALDTATEEHRQYQFDTQFDFHANSNEQGTAHFFRRPKGSMVPISCVNVAGGVATDAPTVEARFSDHWKGIMTTPPGHAPPNRARRRAVIRMLSRKLTSDQREELDRPLQATELASALKSMNPKKSPGPDGWTAGFFQVAPEVFSEILLLVFNYQLLHHGQLLPHQRRSAVALLFKAGDRGDPGNFRPIALMPVEVKVLSKALAYRLAVYAPHLVHRDQAGFVPGRRLHDHVVLVQSLQHYCTIEDHDHYATFLDFSKAYDMVDQDFLFEVLGEFNFGPGFLAWVTLLYRAPWVQIIFGGRLGPKIRPTRGVRQGCPLSCLLFVLYLEPLGEMLRAQPHLGIPLPSGDSLTGIYFADDSTLLSVDLPAAVEQMAIVEEFCAVSGARLNLPKCKTLVLNGHLDPGDIDDGGLLRVLGPGVPVSYLGVQFGHTLPPAHQVQALNTRFLACFQQLGCRARTIQGRRLLVNTMMLSLLWHVTAVVPVPVAMVAQWQSMINKYIMGRKSTPTDRYRPLLPQTW